MENFNVKTIERRKINWKTPKDFFLRKLKILFNRCLEFQHIRKLLARNSNHEWKFYPLLLNSIFIILENSEYELIIFLQKVCIWDVRKNSSVPIECTSPDISHRDPCHSGPVQIWLLKICSNPKFMIVSNYRLNFRLAIRECKQNETNQRAWGMAYLKK